ncbi:tRNA preQ1(34) S-adenosylmethionine ribosyltransferase-isomerase QueA [Candidatus Peregrinibacteria bacterium]|nr:tRNA preQ1(34) S-adenosylmethionine ribosyltransferase-isomerase QueA [Candidatus Peregrinibacteria bacterium]
MHLSDFNYFLPKELIAQTPIPERDRSRLMLLERATGATSNHEFFELPELLPLNSVLVMNDSRVLRARLRFKIGMTKAELLLVKLVGDDRWECMVRPEEKLQPGVTIAIDNQLSFTVRSIEPHYGLRVIEFHCKDLDAYLEAHGEMPIPPYIKTVLKEPERYQTVYSKHKGSVAAPTAGLHFTDRVFEALKQRGIETVFTTLHVGLGTFQPVKAQTIEEHAMHSEWFTLSEEAASQLNAAKASGHPIVAVGTTAVRVLETCADENGVLHPQTSETRIFIYPGYRFKFVDQLVTNFHLPKSTLLMLVSAFAGREATLRAYQEATDKKYRFFSFGDAMLIL